MKFLIMTIFVVAALEFLHTVLTPLRGVSFIRKADFLLHKVATSLALAAYLADFSIGLMGCIIVIAAYWVCRANRKYIMAMGKAVWQTYGRRIFNKIQKDAQGFNANKIAVPVSVTPTPTQTVTPIVEPTVSTDTTTDPVEPVEENPVDMFTAGPVDVDID